MSEIPIGSPPAPPGRHAAPGGWYPDPARAGQERYWDGWQWSRNTRVAESPTGAVSQGYGGPGRPPSAGQPGAPTQPNPYGQPGSYGQQPYGQPNPYGQPGEQNQYQQTPYQQNPYQPGPSGPPQALVTGKQRWTADGVPLAGWWYRVLAAVLDSILISIVATLIVLPVALRVGRSMVAYFNEALRLAEQGVTQTPDPSAYLSDADQSVIGLSFALVGFAYFLLLWRFRGASLGQAVLGLKVVPVDQGRSSERLPWGRMILRSALWTLPSVVSLLLLFQLLNVLFPLWHPKRQALHDRAARTQVVKER